MPESKPRSASENSKRPIGTRLGNLSERVEHETVQALLARYRPERSETVAKLAELNNREEEEHLQQRDRVLATEEKKTAQTQNRNARKAIEAERVASRARHEAALLEQSGHLLLTTDLPALPKKRLHQLTRALELHPEIEPVSQPISPKAPIERLLKREMNDGLRWCGALAWRSTQ